MSETINCFAKYSPDQERDERGRFSSDGSGGSGTHAVSLPANPRRMTIQHAAEALHQMGYNLGASDFDHGSQQTTYTVTDSHGRSVRMSTDVLKRFIYGARKT